MRLIDADALRYEIVKYFGGLPIQVHYDMLKMVDEAPTIEADIKCEDCKTVIALKAALEPVKRGRWIKNDDRSGWHCSCCGKDDLYAYPYTENNEREIQDFYCPNCGAKMFTGEGEKHD